MSKKKRIRIGNVEPLGFFALGLSFVLLGLHLADAAEMGVVLAVVFLFFSVTALMLAGIFSLICNSTYRATVFIIYGLFFLLHSVLYLYPAQAGESLYTTNSDGIGILFLLFFVITAIFAVCVLRHSYAYIVTFAACAVTLLLYGMGMLVHAHGVVLSGGITGMIAGVSAVYCGAASLLNNRFKRTILPLFKRSGNKRKKAIRKLMKMEKKQLKAEIKLKPQHKEVSHD
ncbi:MAG: acetate uptake transporter [Christensenellales bacterium]|jgi:succinate-acetate transporter protein